MFKTTYRYSINPEKQLITLSLQPKTTAFIIAANVLVFGGLWAYGYFLERQAEQEYQDALNTIDPNKG